MDLTKLLNETEAELKGIKSVQDRAKSLERRARVLEQIREAIDGLKKTKTQMKKEKNYDPGKYDTAYFYAKSMDDKDIRPSLDFVPALHKPCPKCNRHVPVVMSYTQTYDSAEGDEWQKQALLICCNNLTVLKTFSSDYRFL